MTVLIVFETVGIPKHNHTLSCSYFFIRRFGYERADLTFRSDCHSKCSSSHMANGLSCISINQFRNLCLYIGPNLVLTPTQITLSSQPIHQVLDNIFLVWFSAAADIPDFLGYSIPTALQVALCSNTFICGRNRWNSAQDWRELYLRDLLFPMNMCTLLECWYSSTTLSRAGMQWLFYWIIWWLFCLQM